MDVRIRRAKPADLDRLVALFDAYRVFYGRPSDLRAARRFLTARFRNSDSVLFVAARAGGLAGFAQVYPSFSSVSMKPLWILNDLYVAPEARREGVASRLMERAEREARKAGAKGLILETQLSNPAKALYEGRGWKRDEQYLHYSFIF